MRSSNLPLPHALLALIEAKKWSRLGVPLVSLGKAAAQCLSPADDELVLMPPPFRTIAERVAGNRFWEGLSNVGQIDYERALVIADFGIGSDSPIILYFGEATEPSVMYLRWRWDDTGVVTHRWIETHATFAAFAVQVGLTNQPSHGVPS